MDAINSETSFSLLYPDEKNNADFACDAFFINAIGADRIFGTAWTQNRSAVSDSFLRYITCDRDVINYRLDLFEDILSDSELYGLLADALPVLSDIGDLRNKSQLAVDDESITEGNITAIKEIELYTGIIEKLYHGLNEIKQNNSGSLTSVGITRFHSLINGIYESDEFTKLSENAKKVSFSLLNIKSVTVGFNLDAQLNATEAGILKINDRPIKSGLLIDRLLRAELEEDEYTTIAPFTPAKKSQDKLMKISMQMSINRGLADIFKNSINKWRPIIRQFVSIKSTPLLGLFSELEFILQAVKYMRELKDKGFPLCKPVAVDKEEKRFEVYGLYNPNITGESPSDIVYNDIEFDRDGMIYILTGPNGGGKSLITCAVGIVQTFFQLGLLVPARQAVISPVEGIYTHFVKPDEKFQGVSRFGDECIRLKKILETITQYSLLLMDETLSGTSAFEGVYIAEDILKFISLTGCRCIFSTHLHELARRIDELNASIDGGVRIDNLTVGVDNNKKRNFKLTRHNPDGKSYAREIAEEFGLSLKHLMEQRNNK